jgi:hypothetical protein
VTAIETPVGALVFVCLFSFIPVVSFWLNIVHLLSSTHLLRESCCSFILRCHIDCSDKSVVKEEACQFSSRRNFRI